MVASEFRDMTDREINDRIRDLREQLFKLRFQKTTGLSGSAAKLPSVRRDVARALTILRERQLAPAGAGDTAPAAT